MARADRPLPARPRRGSRQVAGESRFAADTISPRLRVNHNSLRSLRLCANIPSARLSGLALDEGDRRGDRGVAVHVAIVEQHRIGRTRSEEHTSELQSLMRISYAVFCLQKKK